MAVTTTTRLGITEWSASNDAFDRDQLNTSHISLEARAGIFLSGPLSSRPAADATNNRGFYLSLDTGDLSYSDGTQWVSLNSFAVPVAATPGDTQSAGTGVTLARANHRHAMLAFGGSGDLQPIGTAAAAGSANKYADAGHVHVIGVGAVTAGTIAVGGVSASNQIAGGTITATQLAAGSVTAAAISADQRLPAGAIWGYGGTTAPSGWVFCDGASYTTAAQPALFAAIGYTYGGSGANFNVPSLLSKVMRGSASTSSGLGVLIGADSVTIATGNLPSHTHGVASIGVSSVADHNHLVSGNTGNQSADHSHTFSGTTGNENTSHQHTIGGSFFLFAAQQLGTGASGFQAVNAGATLQNFGQTDFQNANHGHAYSGTTSGMSVSHTHNISFNSGNAGNHTHTLSGTTDATGSGSSIDVRNSSVTVNFIVKL